MAAKKTEKRATAGSTSTPRETTAEPVFYKVEGGQLVTWPDQDDATIVESALAQLWPRAVHHTEQDDLRTGAARVLDAVWTMLTAGDDRARKTMVALERICMTYDEVAPVQEDVRRRRHWRRRNLPPRAKIDRSRGLATLLELVEVLRNLREKESGNPRLDMSAHFIVAAVVRVFPQLAVEDSRRPEVEDGLIQAWQRRAGNANGDMASVQSERLLLDALVALGVSRTDVENWLKGVPV